MHVCREVKIFRWCLKTHALGKKELLAAQQIIIIIIIIIKAEVEILTRDIRCG
jgi:hypothetical protein